MSKTLVLVVSDKGGTGKSTWARAYADWLRRKHPTAFLADADGTVGQLLQFYGSRSADGVLSRDQDGRAGVAFFDIHRDRERDAAFDGIDSGAERVLIDLPAGAIKPLATFNSEVGYLEHARRKGYSITLVNVITPMLASGRTVAQVIETFHGIEGIRFLVVRNRFYGPESDDFERYENGKGRSRLLELGGLEIDLPPMRMRTYVQIDEMNLSFSAATTSDSLKSADQSVAFKWLERFDAEIAKAAAVL